MFPGGGGRVIEVVEVGIEQMKRGNMEKSMKRAKKPPKFVIV